MVGKNETVATMKIPAKQNMKSEHETDIGDRIVTINPNTSQMEMIE